MAFDREALVEVEDLRRGAAGVGHLVDLEVGTKGARKLDLAHGDAFLIREVSMD
jgi:hypothetical protein